MSAENNAIIYPDKSEILENFCEIGIQYWNPQDRSFNYDMSYEFDGKSETRTFDLAYARRNAVNCIIDHRDSGEDDGLVCSLEEVTTDGRVFHEIITDISQTNRDFVEYVNSKFDNPKIIYVSAQQQRLDCWNDGTMEEYNMTNEAIEGKLSELVARVMTQGENAVLKFAPFGFQGENIDGISWHKGIDGARYFVLETSGRALPGMQDYRLFGLFTHLGVMEQKSVLDGLNNAVDDIYRREAVARTFNECQAVYPGTSIRLWNCTPYTVLDMKVNDSTNHMESITVLNGKGKSFMFSGDKIDERNRLVLKMKGMEVKYDIQTGKTEFLSNNERLVNDLIEIIQLRNVSWREGVRSNWEQKDIKGNSYFCRECIAYDKNHKPAFEFTVRLKGYFIDGHDDIVRQLDSFAVSKIVRSEVGHYFDEYDCEATQDIVLESKNIKLTEEQYHSVADLLRASGVGGLQVPGVVVFGPNGYTPSFLREKYVISDNSKNFSTIKEAQEATCKFTVKEQKPKALEPSRSNHRGLHK